MQKKEKIGGSFEHFNYIIKNVNYPKRVKICWDTCHLFSAGYDIRDKLEEVIQEFEEKVGLKKISVIHVNDSLRELGSGIDRHQNIGKGKIGLEALKKIVQHPKFKKIPKFLETPWVSEEFSKEEIRMLKE